MQPEIETAVAGKRIETPFSISKSRTARALKIEKRMKVTDDLTRRFAHAARTGGDEGT